MATSTMVTLGIMMIMGIMCPSALARTAGIGYVSFINSDGGTASGAAESVFTTADGTKKGECSFTNTDGTFISVKYEESSDGSIITGRIKPEGINTSVPETLAECRSSIAQLQKNAGEVSDAIAANNQQLEQAFQNQMEVFHRQQQAFQEQQENFFKSMDDFMKNIWTQQSKVQSRIKQQHEQFSWFNPFSFATFW